jgi:hypothetical protein
MTVRSSGFVGGVARGARVAILAPCRRCNFSTTRGWGAASVLANFPSSQLGSALASTRCLTVVRPSFERVPTSY